MPVIQPTAAQYARMMALLMPPGRLRTDAASDVYKVLLGAGDELARVSGRIADMLAEADPEQVTELLPEFEEMLGLTATGTEAERRARGISHLLQNRQRRPADYQTILASLLALDAEDVQVIERSRAWALLVGEAKEIYRFFVYRDPALAGTPDIDSAQALLDSMAHSHRKGHIIESIAFACDDANSLCDRDILGGHAGNNFQALTGLTTGYTWAGDFTDVTASELLTAIGTPTENVAALGLRSNNRFSNEAWEFTENSTDALELASTSDFDFDAAVGPSWIFAFLLRTTGGAPAASRTIYGDRDNGGNGAEILMNTSGHLLWTVDGAFRTLGQNYADDEWHALVVRWRYDTDTIDMASETNSTATAAVGGTATSAAAARFGAGQTGRPAALGCQIAFVTSVSGDQVHDANLSAIATALYDLLINPVYRAA